MSRVEIRSIAAKELRTALRLILAGGGQSAVEVEQHVSAFINYAKELSLDLSRQWLGLADGRVATACCCIESAGRTAMLLLPDGAAVHVDPAIHQELALHVVASESERGVRLLQCLLSPDDQQNRKALRGADFRDLARMLYLQCSFTSQASRQKLSVQEEDVGGRVEWLTYAPQTHAMFAALITATYTDSLDCRALTGLRDIEDVIAGHKSAGRFMPHRWLLAVAQSEARGCILFDENPPHRALELVYMGVHPRYRGLGLGKLLLKHGLDLARGEQFEIVTVAVDEENTPARKLYERFGFRHTHTRQAMIRSLASRLAAL
jgi:ribosomal protein S18 acetylase RimI-like enzyme